LNDDGEGARAPMTLAYFGWRGFPPKTRRKISVSRQKEAKELAGSLPRTLRASSRQFFFPLF